MRTKGLSFRIVVNEKMGNRIQDLRVRGEKVDPLKDYTFTGWASMAVQSGPPVYDIVLDYIRKKKRIKVKLDRPELII